MRTHIYWKSDRALQREEQQGEKQVGTTTWGREKKKTPYIIRGGDLPQAHS